jgi:mRNA interferase MazF
MKQGEVWLVALEPVQGSEIGKARPCVIVSPEQMNRHLQTVVVAPMTSVLRDWPYRVDVRSGGRDGQVTPDQIRCVSKTRLRRRLGALAADELARTLRILRDMFA